MFVNSDEFSGNNHSVIPDELLIDKGTYAVSASSQSMSSPPTVASYIRVLLPDNSVISVERQQYIYILFYQRSYME